MTWGRKKNVTMALRVSQIKSLREESARRKLSQAQILREALDLYLGNDAEPDASPADKLRHHLRVATLWAMHIDEDE